MMQIFGVKKQNGTAISVHLIISIIFSVLQVSGTSYLCQYPNDHLIISRQSDLQEYLRIRHYSLAVLSLSAYLDQLEHIKKSLLVLMTTLTYLSSGVDLQYTMDSNKSVFLMTVFLQ